MAFDDQLVSLPQNQSPFHVRIEIWRSVPMRHDSTLKIPLQDLLDRIGEPPKEVIREYYRLVNRMGLELGS